MRRCLRFASLEVSAGMKVTEARLRASSGCSANWSCQAPPPSGRISPNCAGWNEMVVSWIYADAAENAAHITGQPAVGKDEQHAPHLQSFPQIP